MKIRETSIEFGRINKRKMFQKQDDIEKTIKILEEQTANIDATDCQNVWSELEKKRRELETIIEYQTKGAILRSKSRWYNEGEKNTKYFLNLEKRHCKQGTITQLKVNDKDLIQSDREILHECKTFYKNLYSSKVQVNDYPEVFFPPAREVLSEERKQHCEGFLSSKECLEALNGMATEKTPGTDGLPCEFYKVFWKDVGETLTEALNFSYQTGSYLDMTTALGLTPDSSSFKLHINFCCLIAKNFIWICRSKECFPIHNNFLFYLRYIYQLENKTPRNTKKWKPFFSSLGLVS